ncbi:hypothetical protein G3O08_20255 [Cryomorpha ignava]|uniref:DUF7793 domain-containing protein n=1 Tax=Cryomorpha ignava TaxID=101383 RepID=A0A7K3WWC4_9FLAO|nr:hypothetical protein [Cryomorpha ignava]NEN25826.1 hypothetical protein [Cryomorpha ignava]
MINQKNIGLKELHCAELPSAKFVELERDIVIVIYKDISDEFGLEHARKHTETIYKLRNDKPCHIILYFLKTQVVFSNAARDYFAKDLRHSAIRLSQAIIIEGLAQKIVANFYKTFHKPDCPVELFSDLPTAINWTLSLEK